jgi:TonB family protein
MKKMNPILLILLFVCSAALMAQPRSNGKVTIEIEKGGVEKGRIRRGLREGTWKSYNAKGELIQVENFLAGKRHGSFTRREDSTVMTGNYASGLKHGAFITKVNDRTRSEIHYSNDTLHGKYFVDEKEKYISGAYERGLKHGQWIVDSIDYEKKHVREITDYHLGMRNGESLLYVNTVLVSRTTWLNNHRNGNYETFDPVTGKRTAHGNYLNGEKHGVWVEHYSNGTALREAYENGRHSGNSTLYEEQTVMAIHEHYYYPDGSKRRSEYYGPGGILAERWYYNEEENLDSVTTYYADRKIKSTRTTEYVNKDGLTQFYLYTSYHRNGKIAARGYEYLNQKSGSWLFYDSTGTQTELISYNDGLPFGWFKAYHPNGKVKLQAFCYDAITDTITVYSKTGARVPQKDPLYSKTIAEVQASHPEIQFRDPNKFPADHRKKGKVTLGDPVNDGKWADVPAQFPGGSDSLRLFVEKHLRYPEPERRLSKEGEVHIRFLIEEDGSFSDIQIVKSVVGAPGFTKESLRVLRLMPKWIPARTGDKNVKMYYTLPVKFVLQ